MLDITHNGSFLDTPFQAITCTGRLLTTELKTNEASYTKKQKETTKQTNRPNISKNTDG